jgi:hypothetical protein
MSFRPLPSQEQAQSSAAFVANMEGVLAVYHLPRDSGCPVVCLDLEAAGRRNACADAGEARPPDAA